MLQSKHRQEPRIADVFRRRDAALHSQDECSAVALLTAGGAVPGNPAGATVVCSVSLVART